MEAYLSAARHWPPSQVHHERFAATHEPANAGGYTVYLARDGRQLQVPAGKSMLDVLLDAGLDLPYSCTQGVCGSCKLGVLGGVPDHRDACLSPEEQQGGQVVIPCCSGARSDSLLLDL
jgi:vanillate O-demethylase ferredoxin subunit